MDPFIRVHDDMIDPALCRAIVEKFEQDPRARAGEVVGTPETRAKRSTDLGISALADWAALCRALDPAVSASYRRYGDEVPAWKETQRGVLRETGYQIQRYQPGGDGFDWHADVAGRASASRALAMIAYLNTVTGGETEFRAQGLAVTPRAGSILWFPPTFPYVHRGRTPGGEPKYVITCFLCYPG
jgi:hypothetical protein